jgi:hypothetical protein
MFVNLSHLHPSLTLESNAEEACQGGASSSLVMTNTTAYCGTKLQTAVKIVKV